MLLRRVAAVGVDEFPRVRWTLRELRLRPDVRVDALLDGAGLSPPVACRRGETVDRDGFVFTDLVVDG